MKTVYDWLSSAAGWRCGSLLFQSPTPETCADLRSLAEELPDEFRPQARELSAFPLSEWEEEYHRVIGPSGIPACESSYDENALAGRGPLLAEISGFYQAFAYDPKDEIKETPDHLSVELGFLSYLALKVAYALHEKRDEDRKVAEDAYRQFLEIHPLYWMRNFRERIIDTGSPFYIGAVGWLDQWTQRGIASLKEIEQPQTIDREIEKMSTPG